MTSALGDTLAQLKRLLVGGAVIWPMLIPELLTEEQIVTLIAAPDVRTFQGRQDRMILLTFLETGCRASELRGMDVGAVSIPLVTVTGKGRKDRVLALSPPVQREMMRYLRVRGTEYSDEGPLLASRRWPGRLCRNRAGRIVVKHARKAGIEDERVTPLTCSEADPEFLDRE